MRSGSPGVVSGRAALDRILLRRPGIVAYSETFEKMKLFTGARDDETPDELWLLEHPPVYTLGQTGRTEHVLDPGSIPVVPSDRGGQVTYHGPGQLIGYLLIDLRRKDMGVRDLVSGIEHAVIAVLREYGIDAAARREAPGVYVGGKKIAALGLRIRKGRSYHGLSLNVDMDTAPFLGINPCGYEGLAVTTMKELGVDEDLSRVSTRLVNQLVQQFGYDSVLEA